MNIMLVNHYAGHPLLGMEYRPFHMASEWRAAGHKVEIIAASYSHVRQKQPKMDAWLNRETMDGVDYTWLKTPTYSGNGLWRLVNIFCFLFQLFRYSILGLKTKPDVIIASSTYPLDIYLCRWMARKYKAKLVFEVHDLWPLSPIELGGVSKHHPFMLLLQHAENYAYKHADEVVSMLPCALGHMKAHGLDETKYHHVPNGVLLSENRNPEPIPKPHSVRIQSLRSEGAPFLVAYAGAFGVANDLESFIQSAQYLPNHIHLLLVGQGPEEERLKSLAKKVAPGQIHFFSAVNKTQVPSFLEQMDALYIGLKNQPLFRFGVSPNKLMDYMMATKPIIYAVQSGNHPVLEAHCGVETTPGDPQKIAQSIVSLSEVSPVLRQEMGKNGQTYITQNHSYKELAKKFLAIMAKQK